MSEIERIKPNPGSQDHFVQCPCYEALYHGTRGPGKTRALGFSFLTEVGKGHGKSYKGILFRRKHKELYEISLDFEDLFTKLYGNSVQYNRSQGLFIFPEGESLRLAYAFNERDYPNFHGQAYGWIAFDELTSWTSLILYERIKSLCRSSNPNIPLRVRATTNSTGPGHQAVKDYFKVIEAPAGKIIENEFTEARTHIWGSIAENPYLLGNKTYIRYLLTQGDPNILKSWLLGSWDILAGGALSDVWRSNCQIIEPFTIPKTWRIYRNIDWGSARPYAVLYIAESDGSPFSYLGKTKESLPGDIFLIGEIYGWGGGPNIGTKETPTQVRNKMVVFEKNLMERHKAKKIYSGVADSAMFSHERGAQEQSVIDLFLPLKFQPSIKQGSGSKGSRITGLELVRERLSGSLPDKHGFREEKGMFIFNLCSHAIRTLPTLPRDERNPEDVDPDSEDHIFDTLKYYVRTRKAKTWVMYG